MLAAEGQVVCVCIKIQYKNIKKNSNEQYNRTNEQTVHVQKDDSEQ